MSNLRLLNETAGTGVSTLSVTDVFTSDFDIYKIEITCASGLEQETDLQLINPNGNVISASNYDYAQLYMRAYTSDTEIKSTTDTDFRLIVGDEDSFGGSTIIYVFNPFKNSYTYVSFEGSLAIDLNNNDTVSFASTRGSGVFHDDSPMAGFHLKNNNSSASVDYTATTYGLRVDT